MRRGEVGSRKEILLHPSKMAFEIPDSLHAEACSPTSTTAAVQTDRAGRRNPDIGSPTPHSSSSLLVSIVGSS